MDEELKTRLEELETKVDRVMHSAELTRKYILWTVVISVALFILPLIGLAFVIPKYLQTLNINSYLK